MFLLHIISQTSQINGLAGLNDWQAGLNDSTVFHLFPLVKYEAEAESLLTIHATSPAYFCTFISEISQKIFASPFLTMKTCQIEAWSNFQNLKISKASFGFLFQKPVEGTFFILKRPKIARIVLKIIGCLWYLEISKAREM